MSLLTNQTTANKNNYFFLLANVSTLTANEIIAKNISTGTLNASQGQISSLQSANIKTDFISSGIADLHNVSTQFLEADFGFVSSLQVLAGNISSIVTNNIVLDGNFIDTGGAGAGATLLLNGFPIVTAATSSFSTLSDWSYFPAVSTLFMGSNNIVDAGNITCQNIYNALNIQTDTLNALTAMTAPSATITNLRTTNTSTTNLVASNINVGVSLTSPLTSTIQSQGQRGVFAGLSSLTVSTGTARANAFIGNVSATTISTNALTAQTINGQSYAPASNWSQFPATSPVNFNGNALTNTTGQTFSITPTSNLVITTSNNNLVANYPISMNAGDISMTANGGADVGNNATVNLTASNGFRGQINLTANPGFGGANGEINLVANGGTIGGVGIGGNITLTANTPIGLSNLTSAIKFSAAGVNSYAGAIPSIASLAGYNFIYGTLGVNICAGLPPGALPNTAGTTYIYGTLGVEIPSDAYQKAIYPYWDGLTTPPDLRIEGRYIIPNLAQVCVRMSNVRQIDFQSNVATYISNCDNITMSANGQINSSNIITTNGSIGTLSNGSLVGVGSASITGYSNINTNNLNTSFINSLPIAAYLGSNFSTFQTASISSATISSINGVGLSNLINQSNFDVASISSATISSINNFASFGSKSARLNGDVAQLQLYNNNPGGFGNNLNLLARVGYSEIQSFNSNFTTATNLLFTADNFGFNVNPADITGGIEMDISGNTQVRGDLYVTGEVYTSTITGLQTINGKDIYTFGEFLTTTTITVSAANTPTVIPFDTNTVGNQVSLSSGAIQVAQAGLYELKVSIQFDKSGGSVDTVDFWVRVNGNDVANTASQVSVNGTQGETLGTCFYYLNLNASDTVELAFASADATMAATYFPAWVAPGDPYDRPAIPAVIANIKLLR